MATDATLTEATLSFHTTDGDDKDFDTHVTVTARDRNGLVAGRVSDDFGPFPNNSDNGPFNLVLENPSTPDALRGGSVAIRIDPVGEDRWTFDLFADFLFSDGSHLTSSADGIDMDQDRQEQQFGID